MTWQPIETAPKDGTEVLACAKGYKEISIVAWVGGSRPYWQGRCDGQASIEREGDLYTDYHKPFVTHWMHLPPPPETAVDIEGAAV